jgi:hypothetical protein
VQNPLGSVHTPWAGPPIAGCGCVVVVVGVGAVCPVAAVAGVTVVVVDGTVTVVSGIPATAGT